MIIMNLVLASLVAVTGFSPTFQPPSCGIGAEAFSSGVRSFSMGGVAAGVPDSNMVSLANPSSSAWAQNTGLSWGMKARDTEDLAWSGAADFPDISMIIPMPLNLQLSGVLNGRSRINVSDTFTTDSTSGTIDWSGGTAESYLGLTLQASRNFSLSLGGKCFFGSALGNAVTSPLNPGGGVPLSSYYRDDISFSPSWGPEFGAFLNTRYFAAGFSIVTDRSGLLEIQRDYIGNSEADTTSQYSVPGELTTGISARVYKNIVIGLDYYARKAITLLDTTTAEGGYIAAGIEISPLEGFNLRGGYRKMDGLWRDGATRYSGGLGYEIAGGKASFDVGVSFETWGIDESETVLFMSVRAAENWLGR